MKLSVRKSATRSCVRGDAAKVAEYRAHGAVRVSEAYRQRDEIILCMPDNREFRLAVMEVR